MSLSPYIKQMRAHVGHDLLLLPSIGAAVYDDAGRILLTHHADHDAWVWPGGCCEPDEVPADCVVREVWEETGLFVEPVSLLGVCGGPGLRVHYPNQDRVSYVMSVFECKVLGGALRADHVETLEAKFFPVDEVRNLRLAPWVPQVLPVLLSRQGCDGFQRPTWRPDGF